MSEKIRGLTAKRKFWIFVVWICNGAAVAMVFWCIMAVTLGFGVIFGAPMAAVVLAVLWALDRAGYELPDKDRRVHNLYSVLGIVVGQIIGFCCFINFPFVSLSPNSADETEVYLCYGASMVAFLIVGQVIRGLMTRPQKKSH